MRTSWFFLSVVAGACMSAGCTIAADTGCVADSECRTGRFCAEGRCTSDVPSGAPGNGDNATSENSDANSEGGENGESGENNESEQNNESENSANNDENNIAEPGICRGFDDCPPPTVCSGDLDRRTCEQAWDCRAQIVEGGDAVCAVEFVCEDDFRQVVCEFGDADNGFCVCLAADTGEAFEFESPRIDCDDDLEELVDVANTTCGWRLPRD